MKPVLKTWNSLNINDGTYLSAYFPPGQRMNLSANPIYVERASDFPKLTGRVLGAARLTIGIQILPNAAINTYRETIKQYFNVTDSNRHNLVVVDADDSDSTEYYVTGFPTQMNHHGNEQNIFDISLSLEYPYWQSVSSVSDSWDITASGDSDPIVNTGNINVPPIFTITPTTTKTAGLKYRRYVSIYNNMDKSINVPLDVTNGGLDVQSLINANKMQADGDDFRVWIDGGFADRWLYGMDSDSDPAKCWVNYDLQPRHEAITSATFDSDDTTISLVHTRKSLSFLETLNIMPNKTLWIDSEALVYSDSDIDFLNYQINNLSRGQKGTTAVSHSSASTIRHIEHDTWIMYGDSDLASQDVDSDFQPIFDLSSTNNQWSFTYYYDSEINRPGAWKPEIQSSRTNLSYPFTGNQNSFSNPATQLGLAFLNAGDFQMANEAGTLDW